MRDGKKESDDDEPTDRPRPRPRPRTEKKLINKALINEIERAEERAPGPAKVAHYTTIFTECIPVNAAHLALPRALSLARAGRPPRFLYPLFLIARHFW